MYWLTGLLGLASTLAPFLFNYTGNTAAFWTSLGVGIALMVASAFEGAARDKEKWEYWVAALVGFVALTAPFVFNFTRHTSAVWTLAIVGFFAVIISGTKLFLDKETYQY